MIAMATPWLTAFSHPPHLARCERCHATMPYPPLPMDMGDFLSLLRRFQNQHRGCPPAADPPPKETTP
jgi:hypothetical protein